MYSNAKLKKTVFFIPNAMCMEKYLSFIISAV